MNYKQYFTNGKLNHKVKTFWLLSYWDGNADRKLSFDETQIHHILHRIRFSKEITIGQVTIRKEVWRVVEPDYERFQDWATDNLLKSTENFPDGEYVLQGRSDEEIRKIAQPIHAQIIKRVENWLDVAIEKGRVEQFLKTPIEKLKEPPKQISERSKDVSSIIGGLEKQYRM